MEEVTVEQQKAIALAQARRRRAEGEQGGFTGREPAGLSSLANLFNPSKLKEGIEQTWGATNREVSPEAQEIADRMSVEDAPTMLAQSVASPGKRSAGDVGRQYAPEILATAASMLAPPLALPARMAAMGAPTSGILSRTAATLAGPAVTSAPKILAAASGGGVGGMIREGVSNQDASIGSVLKEGLSSGVEQGLYETLGGYAVKVIQAGIGGAKNLPDAAKQAIKWAQGKKAPLPADMGGRLAASLPGRTLGGEAAESLAARRGNQIINQEIDSLTRGATNVDDAAMKGRAFFSEALEGSEGGMKKAFGAFESSVGKEAVMPLVETAPALTRAMQGMERIGYTGTLLKRVKTMLEAGADSRTLSELELIRKQAGRSASTNFALKEIVDDLNSAIAKDYSVYGQATGFDLPGMLNAAKEASKKYFDLKRIPGFQRFAKETGERGAPAGTRNWIKELFTEQNKQVLSKLKELAPDIYQELAAVNLSQVIKNNLKPTGLYGDMFDGVGFQKYVSDNAKSLKSIYGDEVFNALDSFSAYTKFASPLLKRTGKSISQMTGSQMARGAVIHGAELTAMYHNPIVLAGEAGAFALAKTLTNPNSSLFKAFTTGLKMGPTQEAAVRYGPRAFMSKNRKDKQENVNQGVHNAE